MIYLDNAATSLIKPYTVQSAVLKTMNLAASPGRGGHSPAMYAAKTVFKCREAAAELFNVPSPEQIVFTSNATHALNIAINSLASKGMRVLVSGYEHNSVTRPLKAIGAEIVVIKSPLFDAEAFMAEVEREIKNVQLVVCTHVSNVFGFILPIYELAELCRSNGVALLVDASQSAGILDIDFEKLGAEFITMPGHKGLFGPQGTGLLLCKNGGTPLLHGGSGSDSINQYMPEFLPDRLEAGTLNVPGIAGLHAGIEYILNTGTKTIREHEQLLLEECANCLSKAENIELFRGSKATQSGVLSLRSGKMGSEELARLLAEKGVCVRAGLHCSPYAHKSAGTLETGTVRISFSPFVSLENTLEFCEILQNLLH